MAIEYWLNNFFTIVLLVKKELRGIITDSIVVYTLLFSLHGSWATF